MKISGGMQLFTNLFFNYIIIKFSHSSVHYEICGLAPYSEDVIDFCRKAHCVKGSKAEILFEFVAVLNILCLNII